MHTGLTPPGNAFHELPPAQPLSCGITAHLIGPTHLQAARAWRHKRHDQVAFARHTGWFADVHQFEVLTGYVYAFADDAQDLEDDDDAPTYYAMVESSDTDLRYLNPDAYDDPLEAAAAADRMAELIAELERDCDAIRDHAAHARGELAEANRLRSDAFAILRHVQACPINAAALGPMFQRLYRETQATRRRAFELIEEHRPLRCSVNPEPGRTLTPDECRAAAWRDGWDSAG